MNKLGNGSKMVIYQVLPRLYGNLNDQNIYEGRLEENGCGKFSIFKEQTFEAIKQLGTTHIWYTGVIEHATKTDYTQYGIPKDHTSIVKGEAGSPYAIKDYYDIDPDLVEDVNNRIGEFQALIERTHAAGLKVIIDFVPNHVSREYRSDAKPSDVKSLGEEDRVDEAFSSQNNFYYFPGKELELIFCSHDESSNYIENPAKVTGNDVFFRDVERNDWYETIKLNYGVNYWDHKSKHFDPIPNTWQKMLDILLYWSRFGVDGFRCDMAEMVPVEFWHWAIAKVKEHAPKTVFIAEIYNPEAYRAYIYQGGFDYLYDKVGLYDTLRAITVGEKSARSITSCWQSLGGIENRMLNFLENHDEQRIASDFFAGDPTKSFAPMIVSAAIGRNPFMIYFGQELGEQGMEHEGFSGHDGRTTIFDYWSVDSVRNWIKSDYKLESLAEPQQTTYKFYVSLMQAIQNSEALSKGEFYDLLYANLENPHFNPDKQYAFFRKYDQELVLVASNFENVSVEVEIKIPEEAFRLLNIPDNKICRITNLMNHEKSIGTITYSAPYTIAIGANNGVLLQFDWKDILD